MCSKYLQNALLSLFFRPKRCCTTSSLVFVVWFPVAFDNLQCNVVVVVMVVAVASIMSAVSVSVSVSAVCTVCRMASLV